MGLLWFRRARRDEPKARPAASEAPAAGPERPPRIGGLLLLNLQPADGPAQIEHAPPLGTRDVVVTAIQTLVPGIRFDAAGHGVLQGSDHRLTIEIGAGGIVQAAVAAAEGETGVELLRTLVHNQAWRIYAPRRGVFIDSPALGAAARGD